MKNLFKNLALFALILAIAAPVFAAKPTPKNKDGTKDVEIWYGSAVTEAGPPPADWVAYDIIRKKLGINLKITALPSGEQDQNTKINAAAAANSLPDLFLVSQETLDILVKQKMVAAVEDMFNMMPDRKHIYTKDAQEYQRYPDGHIYGFAQAGSIDKNEGLAVRKDWMTKLGLKEPKTLDEFEALLKAFTEKDPDGNGKADTFGFGAFLEVKPQSMGLGYRLDPITGAFGVAGTWHIDAKGKIDGLNLFQPEYYDAMVYIKKLVDEKAIDPNWMAYQKDDFRASWKQGKFGVFRESLGAGFMKSNYSQFDKNFPEGELVVIAPPVGPKGKSSVGVYDTSYRTYAMSAKSVNTYSDKKQLVAKVLNWMGTNEGYFLLGWGQEGVNYVKDANGVPTAEGLKDPAKAYNQSANAPLTQLRNMVYYNGDVELASRYPTFKTQNGKTMNVIGILREMQAKNWTRCTGMGKMMAPNADVNRFFNQSIQEFMAGGKKLDKASWDNFVTEFKAMGGAQWEKDAIAAAKAAGLIK